MLHSRFLSSRCRLSVVKSHISLTHAFNHTRTLVNQSHYHQFSNLIHSQVIKQTGKSTAVQLLFPRSTCVFQRHQHTTQTSPSQIPINQSVGHVEQIPSPSEVVEPAQSATSSSNQTFHKSLLFRVTPQSFHPYMELARLDKPIGTWLLVFPCWWSTSLAAQPGHLPDIQLMSYFLIGALIMRGAGCTINDMWDRSFDRRVERTLTRPLASGRLQYPQAFAFLTLQLAGGLALVLNFNLWTIAVAFGSIPIVIAYPLMKRITNWPQFVLGLCFNWGAIVGYSAVVGSIEPLIVLPLYAAGVAWTLVYDTIYAHQDVKDDTMIGLKSTAIFFNDKTHLILTGFAGLFVGLLALSGWNAGMSAPFFAISVGGSAAHLIWQLKTLNIHDRARCMKLFVSNQAIGWIVLIGIIAAKLYQDSNDQSIKQSNDAKQIEHRQSKSQPTDDIWHKTGWQLIKEEYAKHINHKL